MSLRDSSVLAHYSIRASLSPAEEVALARAEHRHALIARGRQTMCDGCIRGKHAMRPHRTDQGTLCCCICIEP